MTTTQKEFIWYVGFKCYFETETSTINEAQYWIDYYKRLGFKACALHENGKHQIYVSKTKA